MTEAEETQPIRSLEEEDFPALYRAADRTSRTGQRLYLRALRVDLALLVLGALLSSVDLEDPLLLRGLRLAAATVLGASAFVTIILQRRHDEERWYGGRAAAESVKTLTWRYVTGADPFPIASGSGEADRRFAADLHAVLAQRAQLSLGIASGDAVGRQITPVMRRARRMSLPDRKALYLQARINDQRQWYSTKAGLSQNAESALFTTAIAFQLIALVSAIALVVWPEFPINAPGVLSAAAIAVVTWMQARRHQEIAQSYEVATHELGLIAEQLEYIATEEDFARFVADAESAVSREHTLWVARRDRYPRPNIT